MALGAGLSGLKLRATQAKAAHDVQACSQACSDARVARELRRQVVERGSDARHASQVAVGDVRLMRRSGGGQGRGRTADLPIFSRTLVPTELPGLAMTCGPDGT